eukprot:1672436-Pleurochrysis_carterae.AAC.2
MWTSEEVDVISSCVHGLVREIPLQADAGCRSTPLRASRLSVFALLPCHVRCQSLEGVKGRLPQSLVAVGVFCEDKLVWAMETGCCVLWGQARATRVDHIHDEAAVP